MAEQIDMAQLMWVGWERVVVAAKFLFPNFINLRSVCVYVFFLLLFFFFSDAPSVCWGTNVFMIQRPFHWIIVVYELKSKHLSTFHLMSSNYGATAHHPRVHTQGTRLCTFLLYT